MMREMIGECNDKYAEVRVRTDFFEKIIAAAKEFTMPIEITGEPLRIEILYDPERPSVTVEYFKR
ncbi:MAG: hypothetical protein Q4F24_07940 [Eubacteriales bacterium]|nr:hypothetical protein [Eubacteriales bacterium]